MIQGGKSLINTENRHDEICCLGELQMKLYSSENSLPIQPDLDLTKISETQNEQAYLIKDGLRYIMVKIQLIFFLKCWIPLFLYKLVYNSPQGEYCSFWVRE